MYYFYNLIHLYNCPDGSISTARTTSWEWLNFRCNLKFANGTVSCYLARITRVWCNRNTRLKRRREGFDVDMSGKLITVWKLASAAKFSVFDCRALDDPLINQPFNEFSIFSIIQKKKNYWSRRVVNIEKTV